MVEFLVALGALIVGGVVWFIKRLQKKVEVQNIEIKKLENEKVIDEAKVEALVESVETEKKLDEKEQKNIEEIKEAESAEEVIAVINDDIAGFNSK